MRSSSLIGRVWQVLVACATMFCGVRCATIPPCPAHGGPIWQELATNHFVLATSSGDKAASKMLEDLEALRWSILAATFSSEVDRAGRVSVWLLGEDEWENTFAREWRGVFASASLFDAAIIVPDDDVFGQSAIKHELAHYVLDAYIRNQPRWFAEGMAQYLETIEYRRTDADAVVTLGEWAAYRTGYRSDLFRPSPAGLLTTGEMFAMPRQAKRDNPEGEARFYTTAWLMIQYLVNTHREGFSAFVRDLASGTDANQAFAQRFPDLGGYKFDGEMTAFASNGEHWVREFHVPPPEFTVRRRTMSEAEVHTTRAKVDAFAGNTSALDQNARLARIAANLDEAKAADPFYLHALALDLAVLHRPSSPEIARKVVTQNPDNWLAWYVAAAAFETSPALQTEARSARQKQLFLLKAVGRLPTP